MNSFFKKNYILYMIVFIFAIASCKSSVSESSNGNKDKNAIDTGGPYGFSTLNDQVLGPDGKPAKNENEDYKVVSTNEALGVLNKTTKNIQFSGFKKPASEGGVFVIEEIKEIKDVICNDYACALIKTDNTVIAWGHPTNGGDSSTVTSDLTGVTDITKITPGSTYFVAINGVQKSVFWGNFPSDVPTDDFEITVHSQQDTFAGLTTNKKVKAWGRPEFGGTIPTGVTTQLDKAPVVKRLFSNTLGFVTQKENGSISSWGSTDIDTSFNSLTGGSLELPSVSRVFSNKEAFVALKGDETISTWGVAASGGEIPTATQSELSIDTFKDIVATDYAFSSLNSNGQVITWGQIVSNPISVPTNLKTNLNTGVDEIFSTSGAFLAWKKITNEVFVWGDATRGGTIPSEITTKLAEKDQSGNFVNKIKKIASNEVSFSILTENGKSFKWDGTGGGNENNDKIKDIITTPKGTFYVTKEGKLISKDPLHIDNTPSDTASENEDIQIISRGQSMAILNKNTDQVITFGMTETGGGLPSIKLTNIHKIFANDTSFGGIKTDGSFIIWKNGQVFDQFADPSQYIPKKIIAYEKNFYIINHDNKIYSFNGTYNTTGLIISGSYQNYFINQNGHITLDINNKIYIPTYRNSEATPSSQIRSQLNDASYTIKKVFSGKFHGFVVLGEDGSVFSWGKSVEQNFNAVQTELQTGVVDIFVMDNTRRKSSKFIALKDDGSIVIWGDSHNDHQIDLSQFQDKIQEIVVTDEHFATFKKDSDSDLYGWIEPEQTTYVTNAIYTELQQKIFTKLISNQGAFVALTKDGNVVTWGEAIYGGDSSIVQSQLSDIKDIVRTDQSFAALRGDGKVITWGNPTYGGGQIHTGVESILATSESYLFMKQGKQFSITHPLFETFNTQNKIVDVANTSRLNNSNEFKKYVARTIDGRVLTWGNDTQFDAKYSLIKDQFTAGVTDIVSSTYSFLAFKKGTSEVFKWSNTATKEDEYKFMNEYVADSGSPISSVYNESGSSTLILQESNQARAWQSSKTISPTITDVKSIFENYHINQLLILKEINGTQEIVNSSGSAIVNSGLDNVQDIAATYVSGVALNDNGSVVVWGDANFGGTNGTISHPTRTTSYNDVKNELTGIIQVSANYRSMIALKNNGTVVAWGSKTDGGALLDYADKDPRYHAGTPVTLQGVTDIASNDLFHAAIDQNQQVVLWGINTHNCKLNGFSNFTDIRSSKRFIIMETSDEYIFCSTLETISFKKSNVKFYENKGGRIAITNLQDQTLYISTDTGDAFNLSFIDPETDEKHIIQDTNAFNNFIMRK